MHLGWLPTCKVIVHGTDINISRIKFKMLELYRVVFYRLELG